MNRDIESKEKSSKIISGAFKNILSGKQYKMLPTLAISTYSAICRKLGLVPSKLKLEEDDGETRDEAENKDVRGSPRS